MVYVDKARIALRSAKWRYKYSCHLFADSTEELHVFAARLGLKRSWFQDNPRLPHYDLTVNMRRRAIAQGAKAVDIQELVAMMKARRQ